ncbi:PstC family ABC transporter permease [Desulfopila sp. IMCC35006]|uniref:PstC family ABC transporter permease n=1 Tax=Desulfopila sp. IMCC35006 TaxID=2569542 RepID=UPI001F0E55D8|nr:ABC transporter permease subunit [Desulfopila sp. IMCC35006]
MNIRPGFSVHIFRLAAFGCAFLTIAVFGMMLFLGWPLLSSGQFFVLLTREWLPSQEIYGIYPMIAGSMTIALLALCLSLPISLGTAFVAATLAPRRLRKVVLVTVRFMAGIPTVIYGFVAVFLLVPFMREQLAGGSGLNILTASMVLALLIAPTMIVFFVNGLGNVARSYCLAVDALGGKPVQKLLYLQLPQAWPTVLAGIILGFGRAMGDTLISLMLAGNSIAIPRGVFDSGRTLTAHIALVLAADFASMEFKSIFACGLVLYIFSVIVVILLRYLTGALVRPPG